MGKKILLTNIGGSSPGAKPIAISILTAVLKKNGHEVALFDSTYMDLGFELDNEVSDKLKMFKPVNWSRYGLVRDKSINAKEEFIKCIETEQPDLIAASAFSDMYPHTLRFMKLVKERYDIPVIIGGIHATLLPDSVIEEDCFDALCIGEGEGALIDYIDALEGNSVNRTDIKNLWIKKDRKIYKNPVRPLVEPDDLPFFDYSLFDERQFLRPFEGRVLRSGDYQDKRGCPRTCTYCAYSVINKDIYTGGRVKLYSAERFVEEAEYLKKTYNLEFFKFFAEDIFIRNVDDFAKMSELYARKVGVPFTSSGHPLSVTKEKARLLKKMGCVSVSIALECANPHYREHMLNRKYTNEQFDKSIKIIQEEKIRAVTLNMIGLPRESRKMIFETIELNRKVKPDFSDFGCFFPFMGTPLGDLAVDDGFSDPEEICITRSSHGRSIVRMPQIDSEEVAGIMKMHYFYLKYPKIFWSLFRFCEKSGSINDFIYSLVEKADYYSGELMKKIKQKFKIA